MSCRCSFLGRDMMSSFPRSHFLVSGVSLLIALWSVYSPAAAPAGSPEVSSSLLPREYNAIDLTGSWVSVVTEDWRWRMTTPPKGDFTSIPLTPEGRRVANDWDPASDGSCLAYGAAGLLRMPTRMRISWESGSVLKLETDAGQQTRRMVFGQMEPGMLVEPSLQGLSRAFWIADLPRSAPVLPALGPARSTSGTRHSTLRVITDHLSGGWLRKNGVPYSENAVVTEYYDRFESPNGDEWLSVTTLVDDPVYLSERFITSSHFKRERDGSKWHPTSCKD